MIKKSRKQIFKKSNTDYYEEMIKNKLTSLDNTSKLYLYSKLKTTFKLEDYLKQLQNFNSRQLITKFRISDHNLEVELGRYKKIPRDQRVCNICNVLDNEEHFFLHCQINNNLRHNLIENISKHITDFNQLDSLSKLKKILDPDISILSSVVDYIKRSIELRK